LRVHRGYHNDDNYDKYFVFELCVFSCFPVSDLIFRMRLNKLKFGLVLVNLFVGFITFAFPASIVGLFCILNFELKEELSCR